MQRMILLTAATAGVGACGAAGCNRVPGSDPRGSTTINHEPAMAAGNIPSTISPALSPTIHAGSDSTPTPAESDPPARGSHIQAAAPQTLNISIDNFTFTPAQLTIPAGSKVIWTNRDDIPHTIVSDTKAFKSNALDTDDHFEHLFETPGTFPYFCSIHPHMTGTIIVK